LSLAANLHHPTTTHYRLSMAKVTLFRFAKSPEKFDASTWVNKLEAYLTFSHAEHTIALGDRFKAPRGKLPYINITDGDSPDEIIADSEYAYDSLVKRGIAQELDANLTAEQRAVTVAVGTLVEQMYWLGVKERWIDNFYWTRDQGPLSGFTWPLRMFAGHKVFGKISGVMTALGLSSRTTEEITTIRTKGLTSLSALIGEKKYLHGDTPTRVDAWVFGLLAASLSPPGTEWNPVMRNDILADANLKRYATAIQAEWFPQRNPLA